MFKLPFRTTGYLPVTAEIQYYLFNRLFNYSFSRSLIFNLYSTETLISISRLVTRSYFHITLSSQHLIFYIRNFKTFLSIDRRRNTEIENPLFCDTGVYVRIVFTVYRLFNPYIFLTGTMQFVMVLRDSECKNGRSSVRIFRSNKFHIS